MQEAAYGLLIAFISLGWMFFGMGVLYPVFMVFMNKVVFKSKLSIREILRRI